MSRPRILRLLRIAFSVGCGVVSLLLVMLWVRSYRTADRIHGRIWDRQSFLLGSKEGGTVAIMFRSHGAPGWWKWDTRSYPVDDELSFPAGSLEQYESRFGFGWIVRPIYMVMRSTQTLPNGQQVITFGAATASLDGGGPVVPIWSLVILSGGCAVLPLITWRFSLRTLLFATTLVAVVLGLGAAFQ